MNPIKTKQTKIAQRNTYICTHINENDKNTKSETVICKKKNQVKNSQTKQHQIKPKQTKPPPPPTPRKKQNKTKPKNSKNIIEFMLCWPSTDEPGTCPYMWFVIPSECIGTHLP